MKILLIALPVVILLLFVVINAQSDEFRITRSTTISAPPSGIFARINDLHRFQEWSPWAKLDPTAKNTFSGPPQGVGAAMQWEGNSKIGQGTMTITESRPNELVRMQLDFKKPVASTANVDFILQPQGQQTQVTWDMSGKKVFASKAMGLVMNMDKMVGGEFEKGLATLKAQAEAATA
ncbi:MAG: SRPBCC family protein [Verrucomicrobiota bacterium]|nr:SRPBCC family protein [Verrucomicrobiota bacterium]